MGFMGWMGGCIDSMCDDWIATVTLTDICDYIRLITGGSGGERGVQGF